jgi:hypothetical protein
MSASKDPNGLSKRALNRAINKSLPYTSKLRSATPIDNDIDTQRIRARLNNYGTPKEIAEEGFRVCRLNAALRRDLDEAQRKLQSGIMSSAHADTASLKNKCDSGGATADVAAIKNKLDSGGSAADLAAEAYRVSQVNDELRKQLKAIDDQKKEFAVMDDTLKEMRSELPQMRSVLERTWELSEKAPGVQVPKDLKVEYKKLMTPDKHDWQPKLGAKVWGATPGGFTPAQKAKMKMQARAEKKEDVRMSDDGEANASETERGDDTAARDAMEIDVCRLTAKNIVAGSKRKHSPPPPIAPKKPKVEMTPEELAMHDLYIRDRDHKPIVAASDSNTDNSKRKNIAPPSGPSKKTKQDSNAFWQSRIQLTAFECWEEHVYLSKPGFPFKQCCEKRAKEMRSRDKQRGWSGADMGLEEGEIRE